MQPVFSESDKKFTPMQVVYSAKVATDRSGNERAVHYSKLSEHLKAGLPTHGSPVLFDNLWLAWNFQVNFMYKRVIQVKTKEDTSAREVRDEDIVDDKRSDDDGDGVVV